jgi:hypothetical protein
MGKTVRVYLIFIYFSQVCDVVDVAIIHSVISQNLVRTLQITDFSSG